MAELDTRTERPFEQRVARAYIRLGARRFEHGVEIEGHRIDVYVEISSPGGGLRRIGVRTVDSQTPVEGPVASKFSESVLHLRREWLLDEGVIVSESGFSDAAVASAAENGIGLTTLEELESVAAFRPTGTSVERYCNLPPRNPEFTGQEELLGWLAATLGSGDPMDSVQAITGPGGVGKSQLALEYTYQHCDDYDLAWWLHAEEQTGLAAGFAALAASMGVADPLGRDQTGIVAACRRQLEATGRWLLIFDDAPDPEAIRPFIPGGGGHVLITSRLSHWEGVAQPVPVEVLTRDEAIAFLAQNAGQADGEILDEIARELRDLPLALAMAAAYISETGSSLSGYVAHFREQRQRVWERQLALVGYPDTVATTWLMAFEQAVEVCPAAADVLSICAYLSPDSIPISLFQDRAGSLSDHFGSRLKDTRLLTEGLNALMAHKLVERVGFAGDGDVSLHRMIQAATRDWMDETSRQRWAEAAVRLVDAGCPGDEIVDDPRVWAFCERLLPQVLAAAAHSEDLGVASADTQHVLNQMALYQGTRAQYSKARALYERALPLAEEAFGGDHIEVGAIVNNLGLVLQDLGDLSAARVCLERALRINERASGWDHPNVARIVNNLGLVVQEIGDLSAARACFERALRIDEVAYGRDHPEVASVLHNLARVRQAEGDLSGARVCLERALRILEQSLGEAHPQVAAVTSDLGTLLQTQGNLAGARVFFERALRIAETAYGSEHLEVAVRVNNLGNVLQDLGNLSGARACFERALRIAEQHLGAFHPNLSTLANNLGLVLKAQGDLAGARRCFQRALGIDEAAFGRDHPDVATDVANLGVLLAELGEMKEARELLRRSVDILEQSLGFDHPNTRTARRRLTALPPEA